MTALEAVASYLPPLSVPIEDLKLGLSDTEVRLFRRFFGLSRVLREPEGTVADLLLSAAAKLDALRGREGQVRYVVHARALQSTAPYPINPLEQVRRELGLTHAVAFGVSQHACATGLLAVELCGRLLAADGDPDALALVLAGELAFTPSIQQTPGTTIMGEGAAAVLVRPGEGPDRLLGSATRTRGEFNGGLTLTDEMTERYLAVYGETLAEVMLAALERAGLTLADLDLVLPHNVNRVSWVRLCKRVGLPVAKVFLDNVPVTGHCFSADPFINYRSAVELGVLRPGHRYLMAAVGRGSTFSALVFER